MAVTRWQAVVCPARVGCARDHVCMFAVQSWEDAGSVMHEVTGTGQQVDNVSQLKQLHLTVKFILRSRTDGARK